jgi:hypothetical protein
MLMGSDKDFLQGSNSQLEQLSKMSTSDFSGLNLFQSNIKNEILTS